MFQTKWLIKQQSLDIKASSVRSPGVNLLASMRRHHSDQSFSHQFPNCLPGKGSTYLQIQSNEPH